MGVSLWERLGDLRGRGFRSDISEDMQNHAKLRNFESFFGFSVLPVERQSKSGSILRCVVGPCDSDSNSLGKLSAVSRWKPVGSLFLFGSEAAEAKAVIGYSSDLLTGRAPDLVNLNLHTVFVRAVRDHLVWL